ncbi:MAG: dTDP-4-amino-4,6-dideoxygalactose transaminase [Eubacterium sp.]|nr:dTDP-4-amino-4,6-dideoxygalactose transaminase [Eubacterium sp.]
MTHIRFNIPPRTGREQEYLEQAIQSGHICGDGTFTMRCEELLEKMTGTSKALLTTSCTQALEMAALLSGAGPGDEVIMPSYTFVSTANAFVLRGARIVFVDVRPDTMNIDENLIEPAVTERTRAIVPVHYAGVGCNMDRIMDIASKYGLKVIEDAAQGVMASYKGKALGTFGDFGCFSFHETKNYSMGEGGAILVNHPEDVELAEIVREKGTNRRLFMEGKVDKYTWVHEGSSYLPSDINAAYLLPQLEDAEKINSDRLRSWNRYHEGLLPLEKAGNITLPVIPDECSHNAHMFYIKVRDNSERKALMDHLGNKGIMSVFHYVPLHTSEAGLKYGEFRGEDRYTTCDSSRLLRLPMYYGLTDEDIDTVTDAVKEFYSEQ